MGNFKTCWSHRAIIKLFGYQESAKLRRNFWLMTQRRALIHKRIDREEETVKFERVNRAVPVTYVIIFMQTYFIL